MKLSLFSALTVITLIGSTSYAQTAMETPNRNDITIGPFFTAGASGSAGSVATGTKTDFRFAFSGGALGFVPISSNVAFGLGLAYDSRGVNYHVESDATIFENYTFSYFNIQPTFRFSDFFIGAGIGLPLSVSIVNQTSDVTGAELDYIKGHTNTLVEARLGGMIELDHSDLGEFRVIIVGAYPFNKLISGAGLYGSTDETKNNGPLPTVQIGVTYLFDVVGHK